MTIQEIYERFDAIGCCTFATVDGDYPETRIAHFLAYDEEGLYFMTMNTKPFYKQLVQTGKVSVCGMNADTSVEGVNEDGMVFEAGYTIRLTGDVREVSMDEIKAKDNPAFNYCIEDQERYPAMTTFVVYRAKGEVFDYDFERVQRNHKLERVRFSYGGFPFEAAGLRIGEGCIGCGTCVAHCSFDAIEKDGERYKINGNRCDECGNCVIYCPAGAVIHKGV